MTIGPPPGAAPTAHPAGWDPGWGEAAAVATDLPVLARVPGVGALPGRVTCAQRGACLVATTAPPGEVTRATWAADVLAASTRDPEAPPATGDWVLLALWPDGRTTVEVVLTKADLVPDAEHAAGGGLAPLRSRLAGGATLALVGASGSGKSTLVNALVDDEVMPTRSLRSGGTPRPPVSCTPPGVVRSSTPPACAASVCPASRAPTSPRCSPRCARRAARLRCCRRTPATPWGADRQVPGRRGGAVRQRGSGKRKSGAWVHRLAAGAAAGAAGTTALNAVTYLDMAVRARPASTTPQDTVAELSRRTGLDVPGDEDSRSARIDALGPLTGLSAGVGTGLVLGAARASGWRGGGVGTFLVASALVLVAGNGPMTLLGITDPRTWDADAWATDLAPHLAFAAVATGVLRGLDRG